MEENASRLLKDVQEQLVQLNVPNAEQYESNVVMFLNQCPDDRILKDATVAWDGEKELDFLWDTERFDCRFSVGLVEVRWHLWAGVNTHNQDDECYQHGIGGMGIKGNEDFFAYTFFESMGWEIKDLEKNNKLIK
ncbi:MAG: hypothetical protein J6T33_06210 [Bacteroidales bacterium]|nr:hypothetical protein [Bacteroidales bacterium]MBP5241709.1 hypothetical protein [Bacteroidales bacterium]